MRLLPAALALVLACGPKLPPGPDDPAKNLAQLDKFADRAQTEAMRAAWTSATDVSVKAKPFGVLPLLLLKDEEVGALSRQLRDPHQQQCLQAIHSLAVRMQSEADRDVAPALAQLAKLRAETQTADALEHWIRQVIAARNAWAQRRSHVKYLALMSTHRGYDPRTIARLEAEVREGVAQTLLSARGQTGVSVPQFDEAHCLRRASIVFTLLGLPEKPPALQIREVRQSPFSSFAFYAIDPPRDQGLTARPGEGVAAHRAAFHEFGHAAMSLLTVPSPSCLTSRRAVSPAVSESCAKIAEELFFSAEWLASQGVSRDEAERIAQWERQWERTRMRSVLDDLAFERRIYDDPAAVPSGPWALKRHLAFEPLERADYLLARCAQAAVYQRLRALPGGLLGGPARAVLREQVFRGASELRFEEWFRRAAGREPDCGAWLEDVAATARPAPRAR